MMQRNWKPLLLLWLSLAFVAGAPVDEALATGSLLRRAATLSSLKKLQPLRRQSTLTPGNLHGAASATKPATDNTGWPPNRGFLGEPTRETLQQGTRVDRYGHDGGTFVAPEGTPFTERALPASYETSKPYKVFEVLKPLTVNAGPAAPWFGQKGMGTQYELDHSVAETISKGYLKPVTP